MRRALLSWYRRSARALPWRRTRDPYRIWVSEVMLQQTRVETVLPYYARFLRAFPNVRALARAPADAVLVVWQGLGYYGRARNLHRAAHQIVSRRDGRLPRTADEWQSLPGVGRYTAGAIASIAFGEREAVLDGNVQRVLTRLYAIEDDVDSSATVHRLWSIARTLLPARSPGDFNQALMELGARVCTPRTPQCSTCPLRNRCGARATGRQHALPKRRARKPTPHYQIVAGAVQRNGRYLLGKRPADGLLGGLWEFPGGKVKDGETHEQALRREFQEELGVTIRVGPLVARVDHAYSHFSITLHLHRCVLSGGRPVPRFHTEIRWIPRRRLTRCALPAANYKCLDRLEPVPATKNLS